jgi:predicted molibdopterin-dependent oxidoreductase YjgC
MRGAARLYATGGNAAIYYGLGVTEHAQGSTTVMGIANLAMATGNIGREGVGVNRCAARTTCRAPATWALPARAAGLPPHLGLTVRASSNRPGA